MTESYVNENILIRTWMYIEYFLGSEYRFSETQLVA